MWFLHPWFHCGHSPDPHQMPRERRKANRGHLAERDGRQPVQMHWLPPHLRCMQGESAIIHSIGTQKIKGILCQSENFGPYLYLYEAMPKLSSMQFVSDDFCKCTSMFVRCGGCRPIYILATSGVKSAHASHACQAQQQCWTLFCAFA